MNILFSWSKSLSLFLALGALSACGGGGDDKSNNAVSVEIQRLASELVEFEDVSCIPQIPAWNAFNNYAAEQAIMPPLQTASLILSEQEAEGGGTTVEIPLIDQNEESLSTMNDLIMSFKDFGSDELGGRIYDGFYPYPSGQERPQMRYAPNKDTYQYIRTRCRTVECVADSVFGNTWGARFYFKENFGLSISGLVVPKGEEYRDSESVRAVLIAISSLPDKTFPVKMDYFTPGYEVFAHNIAISPYRTGETMSQGAAAVMSSFRTGDGLIYNADIMMFDSWKEVRSAIQQSLTIFHELIHLLDISTEKRTTFSQTKEWLDLSDWLHDEGSGTWYANNKAMCSTYGRTNPAEDFAECGVLYRFAPETLKKISKKKYDFYKKKVFRGIEYTSDSKCAKSQIKFF